MTTTTFPTTSATTSATGSAAGAWRILVALALAAMLVAAAFVVGRATADTEPAAIERPAVELGQPVESCAVGQAC